MNSPVSIVAQADREAAAQFGGAPLVLAGTGDEWPIVQAFARHREEAVREMVEDLAWFSGQGCLSLAFYSPVYADDDDQSREWRVTKESGSINDREWDVVGRGETALEAIKDAKCALLSRYGESGQEVEDGRPGASLGQPAGALRAEPVPVSGKAAHQAQGGEA